MFLLLLRPWAPFLGLPLVLAAVEAVAHGNQVKRDD
jgi:hypothetical protein